MAAAYGALLDAVRGMHWPARRAVSHPVAGTQPSRLRGASGDFSEYRLYRQGDDPRRIDWRLLGRSDRAYVRVVSDRAMLPTTIVMDCSASMAFPVPTRAKWRLACEIAIGLAAIAHGDGDPVGVAIPMARGYARLVSPRTRRGLVGEIVRVLESAEPGGVEPLAPTVASIRSQRIVIITDMLGDATELLRAGGVLAAAGTEVHAVHIIANEEIDPPRRTILAADPERPDVKRLLTDSARREYDAAFSEWRGEVRRRWRAAGTWYNQVTTDEPSPRAVRRIVTHGGGSAR